MKKHPNFVQLFLSLSLFLLPECDDKQSVNQSKVKSPAYSSESATPDSTTVYTWNAAKTGPGHMPRLHNMMVWYGTKAEEILQMSFIEGQAETNVSDDGPPPEPRGPYEVSFSIIDDYLNVLRKSGYFSERYLASVRVTAQSKQLWLDEHKSYNRQLANIKGLPLFPQNYEDMLSNKNALHFTIDKNKKIVVLNDNYTVRKFIFNDAGKIDYVVESDVPSVSG